MKTFLTILFLIFLSSPGVLLAQEVELKGMDSHPGYCDGIESTAQALKCVTKHKKDAETELLNNTNTVMEDMDDNVLSSFQEVQNKWLEYRSAECAYEADRVAASGLKQITELSCLAKKTQARADEILQNDKRAREPEQFSEFGVSPRWLNSIKNAYPDVLWANKNIYSADVSCDGSDEKIVSGYKYNPVMADMDDGEQQDDSILKYELSHVLAVARNPVIGKPEITIFEIPVRSMAPEPAQDNEVQGGGMPFLCSKDINYTARSENRKDVETGETRECVPLVEVTSGQSDKCMPLYLSYSESQFTLGFQTLAAEDEGNLDETSETEERVQ